ncbi:ribonuclease P protein subunit p29 [Coemansia spiralis]|nr:ribonuclease P protein subunit p29 [Coemansia spiralis]
MLLLTNPYKNKQSKQGRISSSNKITKKTGRKSITAKERRASKIYDIPKEAHRYELFIPLHEMWSRYIESLMGGKPLEEMNADSKQRQMMLGRLIKADMHGAVMAVDRAKCPNYIGIKGIVAQETKNVFKIITKEDRLVTVPKAHCVFMLELPSGLQCQIYGNQFAFRASERASKKFKPKPTVEL